MNNTTGTPPRHNVTDKAIAHSGNAPTAHGQLEAIRRGARRALEGPVSPEAEALEILTAADAALREVSGLRGAPDFWNYRAAAERRIEDRIVASRTVTLEQVREAFDAEAIAEAVARHLRSPLGPEALPEVPSTPGPAEDAEDSIAHTVGVALKLAEEWESINWTEELSPADRFESRGPEVSALLDELVQAFGPTPARPQPSGIQPGTARLLAAKWDSLEWKPGIRASIRALSPGLAELLDLVVDEAQS